MLADAFMARRPGAMIGGNRLHHADIDNPEVLSFQLLHPFLAVGCMVGNPVTPVSGGVVKLDEGSFWPVGVAQEAAVNNRHRPRIWRPFNPGNFGWIYDILSSR